VNYEYAQNQINNFNIWKIFADELTHGSKKKVRANVIDFIDETPKYITFKHSGEGFVELADCLLKR
jgi:hypothetical protein